MMLRELLLLSKFTDQNKEMQRSCESCTASQKVEGPRLRLQNPLFPRTQLCYLNLEVALGGVIIITTLQKGESKTENPVVTKITELGLSSS